jgi:hypothetical protein
MVSLKESHVCLPLHAHPSGHKTPLSDPRITLFVRRVVKTIEKQERVETFSEQPGRDGTQQ